MKLSSITTFVESLGSDKTSLLSGVYEGGFRLQQVPEEIAPCLLDLINRKKKFKSYLEIGSAAGGTAFLFNHFFEFERMVLIDDNTYLKRTRQLELRKKILNGISYTEIIGDSKSQEVIDKIKVMNETFDIMLIDGDHTYNGVKADVTLYLKYLSKGGYLILHDIVACSGVGKVFEELKHNDELTFVKKYISVVHKKPCGIAIFKK